MEKDILALVPSAVFHVDHQLKTAGFESHLVGGCVRDLILGKKPKDFDIATNAKPEQIVKVFPESVATFAKFGTVLVLAHDDQGERHEIEVTTYRSEMNYVDGRWPAKVKFSNQLGKDLGRRDFTINAMALSLPSGELKEEWKIKDHLVDYFGGLQDLKKGVIRAVGTPLERFQEDGLRGFRACRLASTLNFQIESQTYQGIKDSLDIANQVSMERIRDEVVRTLMESPKPSTGMEFMRKLGLLEIFLPELLEGIGVKQPEFHVHDVYHHTLACIDVAEDRVKLAALFHDIGKPRVKNVEFEEKYLARLKKRGKPIPEHHFFGHDQESAKMTEEIMKRMKFPKSEIERTVKLVRWHMFWYEDKWTDAAVRRFIRRVGEENVDDLFLLRIADATANPKCEFTREDIKVFEKRIAKVRAQEMILRVNDLAVTGHDLMEAGISQGPQVGKILQALLEKVIDDPSLNTKERLLKEVKKFRK